MGRTRAFDPHKDAGSLKAYFRVAQQILVYFDRVAASEDYFFSHEPDEESVLLEDMLEPTDEQLARPEEQRGEGRTLGLVKRCCERYLQQTVKAPMGEILRWRLLLFRVSKDSVGDHEASWDKDEQVLT
ncbi:hypothetical protein LTR38_018244, partial [Friedmanniomyces endolithicus]